MAYRHRENRHTFGQRLSSPSGQLRRLWLVLFDEAIEQALGFFDAWRVGDVADRGGDLLSHDLPRHVGTCVLLQMELVSPGLRSTTLVSTLYCENFFHQPACTSYTGGQVRRK